ncbi:MAG: hypothetical protein ACREP9_13730, partial [Candidatus Dormibacteraceae bacterium]
AIAHGCLLTGLNDNEWCLLDQFEDSSYELRQLTLLGIQNGLAYIWVDDAEISLDTWDIQSFASNHLAAYVKRCAEWYGCSSIRAWEKGWN